MGDKSKSSYTVAIRVIFEAVAPPTPFANTLPQLPVTVLRPCAAGKTGDETVRREMIVELENGPVWSHASKDMRSNARSVTRRRPVSA